MILGHEKRSLLELVEKAYYGKVMLPDFQRNFIWSRSDIEDLIKSLLEGMFIGTMLIQNVDPSNVPFRVIPIEGADSVNPQFSPKPEIVLLDGQQRLTSLFYTLYAPDLPLRNTSYPYAFFIDLGELERDNIEDAVFSWSKRWREYKLLINDEGKYILEELKKRKLLPLTFLREKSRFWKLWYREFEDCLRGDKEKVVEYLERLMNYQVHALSIPLSESPENIALLFERINRTGVKLSIFDLLTARLYKFINLRIEWETVYDEGYHIKRLASDKKDTKIPYYIIQALALSKGLSIKARDMIKIDSNILNPKTWREAVKVLEERILPVLFDVSEFGIPDIKWLPYPSIITVWLGVYLNSLTGNYKMDMEKLVKWYWSVIFTERYSSSTEAKQTKDVKELIAWMKDNEAFPESVTSLKNNLSGMRIDAKHKGSSIYKGVFNLLFKNKAWDFYEKEQIKFLPTDLEDHHIFPKGFLKNKQVNVDADIVLNRTLILSETNRKINRKAPSEYIEKMVQIHGSEEKVKDIFEKHFINEEMFYVLKSVTPHSSAEEIQEKFEKFISMREDLIKNEIEKLIQ